MKIKAVDIARQLGVSKATVSLALNGKPGVGEETKKAIFACRDALMKNGMEEPVIPILHERNTGKIIKVIMLSKNLKVSTNAELDLWTDVNAIFHKRAKEYGYILSVSYVDMLTDSRENLEKECNAEDVAGVILMGAELVAAELNYVKGIRKPVVVNDTDMKWDKFQTVIIDNRGGVESAVDYLMKHGHRDIVYLANDIDIFNYTERRVSFFQAMRKHGIPEDQNRVVRVGFGIENIYQNMRRYLEGKVLPDAFIGESYHTSVGAIRAFREKRIRIGEDISIIGVDELPSYMTGECQLTTVKIPHTERAEWVMMALIKEIHKTSHFKSIIMTKCELVEGNSVKKSVEETR